MRSEQHFKSKNHQIRRKKRQERKLGKIKRITINEFNALTQYKPTNKERTDKRNSLPNAGSNI